MDPLAALAVLAVLVAAGTVLGVLSRARSGRVRLTQSETASGQATADPVAAIVRASGGLGERATLVQFSTEFCSRCPATRRMLGAAAAHHPGVAFREVDVTHRPELASQARVLETPTVFVLDAAGARVARIGGPPKAADIEALIGNIEDAEGVVYEERAASGAVGSVRSSAEVKAVRAKVKETS